MFFTFPEGGPLERRAAGCGVRGRDWRVPLRGPGAAARVSAAAAGAAHPPSDASKPTTSSGPGSRPSPSGSCADAS
jgi:hypothetical protein